MNQRSKIAASTLAIYPDFNYTLYHISIYFVKVKLLQFFASSSTSIEKEKLGPPVPNAAMTVT